MPDLALACPSLELAADELDRGGLIVDDENAAGGHGLRSGRSTVAIVPPLALFASAIVPA